MEQNKQINDNFTVLLYIYEQTEFFNRNLDISAIIKGTELDQVVVEKALKILSDQKFINKKFDDIETRELGKYYGKKHKLALCYVVSDEMFKFTECIYKAKQKHIEKLKREKINNNAAFNQKISDDFAVLLYIYEQTEIKNQTVYFSKIVKDTQIEKIKVSRAIDKLYDHMMIDAEWKKYKKENWAYCYSVSDEIMGFAKGLYNVTKRSCDEKNNKNSEIKNFAKMIENSNKDKQDELKEIKLDKKENEFK